MITFDIVTIFPKFFDSFVQESIIKRAQDQKLIKIRIFDLRSYSKDRHRTVDDKPYGGGRGMVLKLEPIYRAVSKLRKPGSRVVLFSPRGKKLDQRRAYQYSKLKNIVMICGRYEGIDERVNKLVDERLSIGDYVLMGGEVPAMALMEAVTRLIPSVLGHSELLGERIGKDKSFSEYPQYTRPEVFKPRLRQGSGGQAQKVILWPVPKVLLQGHHQKIKGWRDKHQRIIP